MFKDTLVITVGDNYSYTRRKFLYPAVFLGRDDFDKDGVYEGESDNFTREDIVNIVYDEGFLLVNTDICFEECTTFISNLIDFDRLPACSEDDQDTYIGIIAYSKNHDFNCEYFSYGTPCSYRGDYYVYSNGYDPDPEYADGNADFLDDYDSSLVRLIERSEDLVIGHY